jgi:hypothetical protein
MPAYPCRPMEGTRRLATIALVSLLITSFGNSGAVTAGPPDSPVAWPLSTECHKAITAYLWEEQWLAEHFDQDLPLAEFERHQALMKRAWYASEIDCGMDVDQDGVTGYRAGKWPLEAVTRHRH